eukprot:1524154-Amphidinium_carterae.1
MATINRRLDQFLKAELVALAKRVSTEEQAEKRRNIRIQYRGVEVEVSVQSLREECVLRHMTLVKEKALCVSESKFPAFAVEHLVLGEPTESKEVVPAAMVRASMQCRQDVAKEIEKRRATSGSEQLKVVQSMAKTLLVTDHTCKIDIACMQMLLGTSGEMVVANKVLDILPGPAKKELPTIAAACKSLAALLETELLRTLPQSARGPATTALEVVLNLQRNVCPPTSEADSEQYKTFLARRVG